MENGIEWALENLGLGNTPLERSQILEDVFREDLGDKKIITAPRRCGKSLSVAAYALWRAKSTGECIWLVVPTADQKQVILIMLESMLRFARSKHKTENDTVGDYRILRGGTVKVISATPEVPRFLRGLRCETSLIVDCADFIPEFSWGQLEAMTTFPEAKKLYIGCPPYNDGYFKTLCDEARQGRGDHSLVFHTARSAVIGVSDG